MKKLVLLCMVITAFAFNAQSQTNSDTGVPKSETKKCSFKISSLSFESGTNQYRTLEHRGNDFEKPSEFRNEWHSGNMNFMGGRNGDMTSRRNIMLGIGMNPYSKKLGAYNKKRELYIGLYYSGSDLANHHSIRTETIPGDTFSFNTVRYQTDTLIRSQRIFVEKANVIGVNVQYLFKTDPEKRISLFTGFGIGAAYAVSTRIHETFIKDTAVVLGVYGTNTFASDFDRGTFVGGQEVRVRKTADPTLFASIAIPFGVNFRLAKNKDIWNQMNLFMRGDMGLQEQIVIGGHSHLNPYMGCNMGFRFDFK